MQRDLVERARAGDVTAFTALVELRVETMFRTAMGILGSEADARDATQEALASMWQGLPRLKDPERFDAWSARILVNACRLTLRRRRRTVREIPMTFAGRDRGVSSGSSGGYDQVDRLDALERAFDRLGADDRAILVLHHLRGKPVSELAAVLGVAEGTVKSRLHAARRALARALKLETR
jgi:RNA polymerase sigma-70 factor, ECF subfamily